MGTGHSKLPSKRLPPDPEASKAKNDLRSDNNVAKVCTIYAQ